MPISIVVLNAMVANGATAEMVVAVIAAEQASEEQVLTEKRRRDRDRQKAYRLSRLSQGQAVTKRTAPDRPQDPAAESTAATIPSGSVSKDQEEAAVEEQKRTSILTSFLPSDSQGKKEEVVGRARASNRGARIPADWSPDVVGIEFAEAKLGKSRASEEIAKFQDYWCARAGPNALKLDWAATWRTWIRKATEHGGQNGKSRSGDAKNGRSIGLERSVAPDWQSSRDAWRAARAELEAHVAGLGDGGDGEAFPVAATTRRE